MTEFQATECNPALKKKKKLERKIWKGKCEASKNSAK